MCMESFDTKSHCVTASALFTFRYGLPPIIGGATENEYGQHFNTNGDQNTYPFRTSMRWQHTDKAQDTD